MKNRVLKASDVCSYRQSSVPDETNGLPGASSTVLPVAYIKAWQQLSTAGLKFHNFGGNNLKWLKYCLAGRKITTQLTNQSIIILTLNRFIHERFYAPDLCLIFQYISHLIFYINLILLLLWLLLSEFLLGDTMRPGVWHGSGIFVKTRVPRP